MLLACSYCRHPLPTQHRGPFTMTMIMMEFRHAQRGEVAEWKWAGKSSRYIHGSREVRTKR